MLCTGKFKYQCTGKGLLTLFVRHVDCGANSRSLHVRSQLRDILNGLWPNTLQKKIWNVKLQWNIARPCTQYSTM